MAHRKTATAPVPATKTCVACGRTMEMRHRWERSWDEVKYCSAACRRAGVSDLDRTLEGALLGMLEKSAAASTVCPSDVARAHAPEAWEPLMEPVRRAARRLAADGIVEIRQGGRVLDPSTARGPIRIGRGPRFRR
jgi:hypothetical protein